MSRIELESIFISCELQMGWTLSVRLHSHAERGNERKTACDERSRIRQNSENRIWMNVAEFARIRKAAKSELLRVPLLPPTPFDKTIFQPDEEQWIN